MESKTMKKDISENFVKECDEGSETPSVPQSRILTTNVSQETTPAKDSAQGHASHRKTVYITPEKGQEFKISFCEETSCEAMDHLVRTRGNVGDDADFYLIDDKGFSFPMDGSLPEGKFIIVVAKNAENSSDSSQRKSIGNQIENHLLTHSQSLDVNTTAYGAANSSSTNDLGECPSVTVENEKKIHHSRGHKFVA
eukprot:Sdes_comp22791_c0_seq1m21189